MEKTHRNENNDEAATRSRRSTTQFWIFVSLFLCAVGWQIHSGRGTWFPLQFGEHSEPRSARKDIPAVNWDGLQAVPYLDYSPCYEDQFQCALLELPMDYWNGTTDASISLAIIRSAASVPVTHPRYGGAIILNPGGPGGSGVDLLAYGNRPLRGVLDAEEGDEDGLFYDLISFDPRGVGRSEPRVRCFDDPMLDTSWSVRMAEEGIFSSSDASFGRIWSMSAAMGGSCSLPPADGGPDIKKYISTASVARDVLEIAERHGEWREQEARRVLAHHRPCGRSNRHRLNGGSIEVPEAVKYKPGKEMVQYWGFSYGTVLGNTFAAMFPDRIHRLVVDGVVDIYDYKKMLWYDNLMDTEGAIDQFYLNCARVGYPQCPLANDHGITRATDVEKRTKKILDSLYHNPLPVIGPSAEVVTYSDVKDVIFASLYSPIALFPLLAVILSGIEHNDGSILAGLLKPTRQYACPSKSESLAWRTNTGHTFHALMAISCTDGDDQSSITKAAFEEHVKNTTTLSPNGGEIWSMFRLRCVHYTVRPYYRFEGPWEGKTRHPILEVGNTLDPVTPGRFAKKMSRGFEGAVSLLQDAPGHCSISAASRCTQGYIRRYFQTGELPPKGVVCEVDELPFGPGPGEAKLLEVDMEVEKARQRQRGIAEALRAANGGFGPFPMSNKWA